MLWALIAIARLVYIGLEIFDLNSDMYPFKCNLV